MFVAAETYRNSPMRMVAEVDGVVVAMFGVAAQSLLSDVGHPWMFGTPEMERHSRSLIREARPYIAEMKAMYPRLTNIVDARNHKSIRWLKKCGFEIQPAIRLGVNGLPFHPFVMEN
jgi:hypothetical protein